MLVRVSVLLPTGDAKGGVLALFSRARNDQPPDRRALSHTTTNQPTNKKKQVDSIHNYMSYSDDACLDYFSPGQIERLNASFNTLRRGVKVQRGSTGR